MLFLPSVLTPSLLHSQRELSELRSASTKKPENRITTDPQVVNRNNINIIALLTIMILSDDGDRD